MTPLRKLMIEDLQLKGYGERTQQMYVRAVRQLSEHYHKSPNRITEEELRDYFLYTKNVKKWSRSTSTIAICGIKFFFENTIKRDWTTLALVRAKREKKLPAILSREEVHSILKKVRLLRYRVCLSAIYSCGLRLQEGTHLQVKDIDSARGMIHVHLGKGAKDRYVPLPQRTLELLREQGIQTVGDGAHANPRRVYDMYRRLQEELHPAPGKAKRVPPLLRFHVLVEDVPACYMAMAAIHRTRGGRAIGLQVCLVRAHFPNACPDRGWEIYP